MEYLFIYQIESHICSTKCLEISWWLPFHFNLIFTYTLVILFFGFHIYDVNLAICLFFLNVGPLHISGYWILTSFILRKMSYIRGPNTDIQHEFYSNIREQHTSVIYWNFQFINTIHFSFYSEFLLFVDFYSFIVNNGHILLI